jgi:hypothetical protein
MSYLYNKNVNVQNNNVVVSTSNPFPVTPSGGSFDVELKGATAYSAFGEPLATQLTPVIQLDGIYGLPDRDFEVYSSGNGVANTKKIVFNVESGTSAGSYGVLRSRKLIRYRPGQGALCRFTAAFSAPHANTTHRAGLFAQEQSLTVGYNGEQFGIFIQNGGKADIRELNVTTGAGGSETGNVTLNGVSYTVALTSGTTQQTAAAIANRSGGYPGYVVDQVGNSVFFLSASLGPKNGTFSFSSTGAAVAPVNLRQAGIANAGEWIYQNQWNFDRLDGSANTTNPSGVLLAPDKLNIYQINYRWLGAGEIRFAIEDPNNGDMIFFHHYHYSNRHTVPHLDNPSLKIGYLAANLGAGTSNNVSVIGASMMGAIEGIVGTSKYTNSASSGTKATLAQDQTHHLLSIRSQLIFNNKINLNGTNAKKMSVAMQGQDPAEIYIFYNPTTFSGTHIWNNVTQTAVAYSTTDGTYTLSSEAPVATYVLPINGSSIIDLEQLSLNCPPNNIISIGIKSSAQISRATASLIWLNE